MILLKRKLTQIINLKFRLKINIIKQIFITKIIKQKVLKSRMLKNGTNLNQIIKKKRKKEKETKKGKLYRKTK